MKYVLITLLFLTGMCQFVFADGYRIEIKLPDTKDSVIYLAHYYGKSLPTIYKVDSAKIDKKGNAILESKQKVIGGIYLLLLGNMQTYTELLLNDGDNMSVTMEIAKLPAVVFKNSPENIRFVQYAAHLKTFSEKQDIYAKELTTAKTKADSAVISKKMGESIQEVTAYRKDYVARYPNTLLANIFNALMPPQIPEGKHYLPNGKEDSLFAFNYYKEHYWDNFNFSDDRLIHTPLYHAKLEEYINELTAPIPDSVNRAADFLLSKTRGSKELFKYTMHWFTDFGQKSKIMGMDEVFVYVVENYHMKGEVTWVSPDLLKRYIDYARKIAPNVVGNIAPDIKMQGQDNKPLSLYDVKSKYTLLVFWSPECGACMREVPQIDSAYRAALKSRGVTIFAVKSDGEEKAWRDAIEKFKIKDWIHAYDPARTSDYRSQYNVYSTPVIYLLDDKKKIVGKKIDHTNILAVIDMLERKNNTKTN